MIIAYASAYGHTKAMAELIAKGVRKRATWKLPW